MMGMEKTEKSMAELQIDLNMSYEFDKITESGSALSPLSGPGCLSLLPFAPLNSMQPNHDAEGYPAQDFICMADCEASLW